MTDRCQLPQALTAAAAAAAPPPPLPALDERPTQCFAGLHALGAMDITPEIDAVLRCLSDSGLPNQDKFAAAAAGLDQAAVRAMPRAHELSAQQRRRLHR